MSAPPRGIALVALLALSGCRPSAPASEAPALRLVRTIVLGDSMGRGIGWPADLSVAANGDLVFVDLTVPEVLAFDATGHFLRRYGSPGDGPGELQAPRSPVVLNDSLVVITDAAHQTLEVFDRGSAQSLQRVRLPIGSEVMAEGAGGILLLGALSLKTGSAYLNWKPGTDSVAAAGSIPPEYRGSERLAGIYRRVFVAALDSSAVFIVEGSSRLGIQTGGRPVRWQTIPARLRRAPPAALDTRLAEIPSDSVFTLFALVHSLGALADGSLALVHQQFRFLGTRRSGADRYPLTNTLYLTVIDLTRRRACVDAVVPTAGEMVSQSSLRGDTLYVLEQTTDSVDARTTVAIHHIETTGCRWRPLAITD